LNPSDRNKREPSSHTHSVAFKSKQVKKNLAREGAQARLRVGEGNSRDKAENAAGKEIAERAAERDVFAENAGTED